MSTTADDADGRMSILLESLDRNAREDTLSTEDLLMRHMRISRARRMEK